MGTGKGTENLVFSFRSRLTDYSHSTRHDMEQGLRRSCRVCRSGRDCRAKFSCWRCESYEWLLVNKICWATDRQKGFTRRKKHYKQREHREESNRIHRSDKMRYFSLFILSLLSKKLRIPGALCCCFCPPVCPIKTGYRRPPLYSWLISFALWLAWVRRPLQVLRALRHPVSFASQRTRTNPQ